MTVDRYWLIIVERAAAEASTDGILEDGEFQGKIGQTLTSTKNCHLTFEDN